MTKISEKLQLPSTDLNVSVIREPRTAVADRQIAGWVLDEREAYRQIAILPDHCKFSVICLKDHQDSKAKFFVMIGHSFGLVSSVYKQLQSEVERHQSDSREDLLAGGFQFL